MAGHRRPPDATTQLIPLPTATGRPARPARPRPTPHQPPRRRRFSALAALLALAAATTAGCGPTESEPEPSPSFSRDAYCDAMHEATEEIDAAGINSGDAEALERAGDTYVGLAQLAPDRLEDAWATFISGLDPLIAEANGAQPLSPERFAAFRTAYTTIYEDYLTFCVGDDATASPSP